MGTFPFKNRNDYVHVFLFYTMSFKMYALLSYNLHTLQSIQLKCTMFFQKIQCCSVSPQPNFRTFSCNNKKGCAQWQSLPITPHASFLRNSSQSLISSVSPQLYLFWTFLINGSMQYMVFCYWLLSFGTMFSRFIHVIICTLFLFMAK